MAESAYTELNDVMARLIAANWKERDAVKDQLISLALAHPNRDGVKLRVEEARGGITDLELRWEFDEVLEALAPPPVAEPEEEEEDRAPRPSDFVLVYDDPRGLQLYRTKTGDKWFATQVDPRTQQPQTFEVPPAQLPGLQEQLRGSPYWVLGAGGAPT